MTELETAIANLRDLDTYLGAFPEAQRSTRFEHLVTKSLSCVLRLPFFTIDNEVTAVLHRVVWNGSEQTWTRAWGTTDGVAYAYEFCIVVEATLKTDSKQFYDEFVRSLNHYQQFLCQTGLRSENCYLLMLVTELHRDTYTAFQQKVKEGCPYVLLTLPNLVAVLETYALALTARHADLRLLFHKILGCCKSSGAMSNFLERSTEELARWRQEVLEREKTLFVGAKSYKVLSKFGREASAGEILKELCKDSVVTHYFEAMGDNLSYDDIVDSLEQERLAYKVGNILSGAGEGIYVPLPFLDVKGSVKTFIEELQNVSTRP